MSHDHSKSLNLKLICPGCRAPLVPDGAEWKCSGCGTPYTRNEGILSFLTPDERFNEGGYEAKQITAWTYSAELRNKIRRSRLLTFLNAIRIRFSLSGRRDRIFLKEMKPRATPDRLILDLGCGGGRHYFTSYGRVVGIDPVLPLLKLAREIYDEVYQTSGFKLPFADGTFDYVVSSDVLGHITDENKDMLFSEINRVLKPGGRTVHCSEADATNDWYRFARRYPELFYTHFIDIPGHFGMETITKMDARFLRHGFRAVTIKKLCSRIQEPGSIDYWFNNEYRQKSRLISFCVSLDRLLIRWFAIRELCNFILEPLAQIDDALTPLDYGPGALIVYEKVADLKAAPAAKQPAAIA